MMYQLLNINVSIYKKIGDLTFEITLVFNNVYTSYRRGGVVSTATCCGVPGLRLWQGEIFWTHSDQPHGLPSVL
jgi:hypothetical protein